MTGRRRQLAEDAMRALCWGRRTDVNQDLIVRAVTSNLGAVLEHTVRSKTTCLLAAHLRHAPVPTTDRTAARFLGSVLRTSRYKTGVFRQAALTATAALSTAGVPVAVLGGMSVEHALYASTGARQLNDIDLLIPADDLPRTQTVLASQGYVPDERGMKWTRRSGDLVVPLTVIDLATSAACSDTNVADLLSRGTEITFHWYGRSLPVLAPPDALDHTLAQLDAAVSTHVAQPGWALIADAIRYSRSTNPRSPHHAQVLAGWAVLRSHWPQLPATPTQLPTSEETTR